MSFGNHVNRGSTVALMVTHHKSVNHKDSALWGELQDANWWYFSCAIAWMKGTCFCKLTLAVNCCTFTRKGSTSKGFHFALCVYFHPSSVHQQR